MRWLRAAPSVPSGAAIDPLALCTWSRAGPSHRAALRSLPRGPRPLGATERTLGFAGDEPPGTISLALDPRPSAHPHVAAGLWPFSIRLALPAAVS